MTLLDGIWLATAVVLGLTTLFALRLPRRVAIPLVGSAIALSLVQATISGLFWQAIPVLLLVAACGLILLAIPRSVAGLRWPARLGVRAGLLVLLGTIGAAWVFVPVPLLPAPTGQYAVGTTIYRWVDETREETATGIPGDRRNVIVQAWYPAEPAVSGVPSLPYMDGLDRLPAMVSAIPSLFMRDYARIDTHAATDAPVSSTQSRWPVIMFSPGYGAPRFAYTALLADLASRGFVVLAVDHPYEAALTELADGSLATAVPVGIDFDDPSAGDAYMASQQNVRSHDLAFVRQALNRPDQLGPLAGRIDANRVAVAGHSFGGAAGAALAARDGMIRAVINIDGTPYGDLSKEALAVPYLLIESDRAETGHSPEFLEGNAQLLAHAGRGSTRHQLAQANHYSFTDLPLYFSPPARAALSLLIGGSRGVEATVAETNRLIVEFVEAAGL